MKNLLERVKKLESAARIGTVGGVGRYMTMEEKEQALARGARLFIPGPDRMLTPEEWQELVGNGGGWPGLS